MADTLTPLMKQYHAIKDRYPNTLLLYRMGDFYELFFEDAQIASRVLGLTLTARNHGTGGKAPLAGFPYHALDRYSANLVKAGYKIAICEQTEDPRKAKGIVKRDVIEVVTAGTSLDPNFLEERSNNFLACINPLDGKVGFSALDLSTGEFLLSEHAEEDIVDELARLNPAEIILPEALRAGPWPDRLGREIKTVISYCDDWHFSGEAAQRTLTGHFGVLSLEGLGCENMTAGVSSAGAVLSYAKQHKKTDLTHLKSLSLRDRGDCMQLDAASLRNLELLRTTDGETGEGTLLSVLDRTCTAMGSRALRRWIVNPLMKLEAIENRLSAVEKLLGEPRRRTELVSLLKQISDIERIVGRVGTERANARDLAALRDSLKAMPAVINQMDKLENPIFAEVIAALQGFEDLIELIRKAITDEPPLSLRDGNLIRDGYNADLDGLRQGNKEGKNWIASLQPKERERTGINTLKVGYNRVFGYYIEVTKSNLNLVPEHYIRKQTLVNGERFITAELKDWEVKVLGAEEKIKDLENQLFLAVRSKTAQWTEKLQAAATQIARLDVLVSLSNVAERQRLSKPQVDNGDKIWIEGGRHPVVEALNPMEPFIPNDLMMDNRSHQILLITGPNMAGKSTYLRQSALIALMAQIGSYVPAAKARIGIVDKIFTRVGASDKLAKGQSTFLVEMSEVANILRNATPKSLILLDEVGRGTSTYDGLSIAWAVAEHLHENEKVAAKTLFATHYHELAELSTLFPRVRNYNVQVKEWKDSVVFLRKIVEGSCDHSYGIEVARLAGVPQDVINRAKEILSNLESMAHTSDHRPAFAAHSPDSSRTESAPQLSLFESPKIPPEQIEVIDALKATDVNNLTPIQALQHLSELKAKLAKSDENK